MRRIGAILVFLAAASAARGATYYYKVVGGNIVTQAGSSNGVGASFANVLAAKAGGGGQSAWTGGDIIYFDPSGGEFFIGSGPLDLNTNGLELYGNGSTLHAAGGGGAAAAIIRIQAGTGVKFVGFGVKNTADDANTNAGGALYVDASTNDVLDCLVKDVIFLDQPATPGYSPINLKNGGVVGTSDNICNATFENVTFDLGGGYRDIVTHTAQSTKGRSKFVMYKCRMGGATHAATGVSNNVFSLDSNTDSWLVDCEFHTSGGSCIEQVDTNSGRIYAYGCRVWNAGAVSGASAVHAGITAQVIVNCIAFDCCSGFNMREGNYDSNANDTPVGGQDGVCWLVNSRAEDSTLAALPPSVGGPSAGIRVLGRTCVIMNTLVRDFNDVSTTSSSERDVGLSILTAGASVLMVNVNMVNCARWIDCNSVSGVNCEAYNCTFEGSTPAKSGSMPDPYAAINFLGGTGNLGYLNLVNCVGSWSPGSGFSTMNIIRLNGQSTQHNGYGYNQWWQNGNCSAAFSSWSTTNDNAAGTQTGDGNRPKLDRWGRLEVSSVGRLQGKLDFRDGDVPHAEVMFDVGDVNTNSAAASNAWPPAGASVSVSGLRNPEFCGTAGTITATTMVLTGGSATNDVYNGKKIYVVSASGGGGGQWSGEIYDYDGTTKVATVGKVNGASGWVSGTTPSGTVVFAVSHDLTNATMLFLSQSGSPNADELAGQWRHVRTFAPLGTAGQAQITVRPTFRTATAYDANGDRFALLPPFYPCAGNLAKLDDAGWMPLLAPRNSPAWPDMFGRYPFPTFSTTDLRIRPGALTDIGPRQDFRVNTDRGLSRGHIQRADDALTAARE